MCIASRLNLFLLVVLLSAPHIGAQEIDSGAHPGERIGDYAFHTEMGKLTLP